MKSKKTRRLLSATILIILASLMIGWRTKPVTAVFDQLAGYLPTHLSSPAASATSAVQASGVMEADEIEIASEFGGFITAMPFRAGDIVQVGDVLVQLDTAVLDAQIAVAQAGVAVAQAGLAQAQAGSRPTQIAIAEAQLAQAQAGQFAAAQVVSDTLALVANPQDIRLQIAVTQAQIAAADQEVARAVLLKDAAEEAKNNFEDLQEKINDAGGPGDYAVPVPGIPGVVYTYTVPSLPLQMHLTPNQWWQAWVGVNAATAQRDGLQASLGQLYAQYEHPQTLQANVDAALAGLAQAQAQVAQAQAQLDGYRAGATTAQIDLLNAQVAQAQAMLEALLAQRELLTLTALTDGVVVDQVLHPGEVAAPGATLLTLARLQDLRLRVYVPETQLGQVSLGQQVQVTVDSFPQHVFMGVVTSIGDHAEFTPRNVTTAAERTLLVFAVEIHLPNPAGMLKPGMPADVLFLDQ